MRRLIVIASCLVLAGMVLSSVSTAAEHVREAAAQIITGIQGSGVAGSFRIAVTGGAKGELPVSVDVVSEMEAELVAALRSLAPDLTVMSRRELPELIDDLADTGALDGSVGDPIADLMASSRRIDALVIGRYRLDNGEVQARYRLVSMKGEILAVATVITRPVRPADFASAFDAEALETALDGLAMKIADALGDERRIVADMILRGDDGAATSFGSYVRSSLISRLQAINETMVGGEPLVVLSDDGDPEDVFRVDGRFWDLGSAVALSLTLRHGNEVIASWMRHLRPDSLGNLALDLPDRIAGLIESDSIGPVSLSLRWSSGLSTVTVGQPVSVDVTLSRGGYLWCFYLQSDGQMLQLYPNPAHHMRTSDNWIEGGKTRRLPDPGLDRFRLVASKPAGTELLKCIVTDRVLGGELPEALQGRSIEPLPDGLQGRLVDIFRSFSGVAVSEDSLFLTVVEPGADTHR
jgi:hypothetical protein